MILILTGQMAQNHIRKLTSRFTDVKVLALDITVAAFITPQILKRYVNNIKKLNPDIVLVPGLCPKDFSEINIDIPIYKGPKQAALLPTLIELIHEDRIQLSSGTSADRAMEQVMRIIEISEKINDAKLLERPGNFRIKSGKAVINVGVDFRPRVLSEIVDASLKDPEEVKKYAKFFIQNGADIIDIGATIKEARPEEYRASIQAVLELNVPVSADTMHEDEIRVAVDEGIGFILSVDEGNIAICQELPEEIALVVLPTNLVKGIYLSDPNDRVKRLQETISTLSDFGITKILVDPLLEAPIIPGLAESLAAYRLCSKIMPNVPLFAGVGNVTEFVDSDTAGMNALMACLAVELGIVGLLTTEERSSTLYSTRELSLATRMAYEAKIKQVVPKKVGTTAFFAKSPHYSPFIGDISLHNPQEVTHVDTRLKMDPVGFFKIWIDHGEGKIFLQNFKSQNPTHTFIGTNAELLAKTAIYNGLVTELTHAAYLGRELERAEICLNLGKSYVQDERFKTSDYSK